MEVTNPALSRPLYWKLFVHPTENRFSNETLVWELEGQGIFVGDNTVNRFFSDFIYGVGTKG